MFSVCWFVERSREWRAGWSELESQIEGGRLWKMEQKRTTEVENKNESE